MYEIFNSCMFVSGLNRAECASWVQAIGSVLAIGVAIAVAWCQAKQMRLTLVEQEARRIGEKVAPALAIIQAAVDDMGAVYSAGLTDRQNSLFGVSDDFAQRHKWYAQAFAGIEPHTMPSVESTKIVLSVRELFRRADGVMDRAAFKLDNMRTITGTDKEEFDHLLAAFRQQAAALKADAVRITHPGPVKPIQEG